LSDVNPEILDAENINKLFERSFDEMVLSPKKKIKIDVLIDSIEGMHSKDIVVEYDSDAADCVVRLPGASEELYITPSSITVRVSSRTNPAGLIQVYASMSGRLIELAGPSIQLLK
jgi:hypothetical protein